jgi:hypothetical protein
MVSQGWPVSAPWYLSLQLSTPGQLDGWVLQSPGDFIITPMSDSCEDQGELGLLTGVLTSGLFMCLDFVSAKWPQTRQTYYTRTSRARVPENSMTTWSAFTPVLPLGSYESSWFQGRGLVCQLRRVSGNLGWWLLLYYFETKSQYVVRLVASDSQLLGLQASTTEPGSGVIF